MIVPASGSFFPYGFGPQTMVNNARLRCTALFLALALAPAFSISCGSVPVLPTEPGYARAAATQTASLAASGDAGERFSLLLRIMEQRAVEIRNLAGLGHESTGPACRAYAMLVEKAFATEWERLCALEDWPDQAAKTAMESLYRQKRALQSIPGPPGPASGALESCEKAIDAVRTASKGE